MKTVFLVTMLFVLFFFPTPAIADPVDMHCPDHADYLKYGEGMSHHGGIVVIVSGDTVTFSEPVMFCVKAGLDNSGKVAGTVFVVDWLNSGGQIPDISYVVIYDKLAEPTPTPVEPTPTPVEPTPTPFWLTPPPRPTQPPFLMPQTGARGIVVPITGGNLVLFISLSFILGFIAGWAVLFVWAHIRIRRREQ